MTAAPSRHGHPSPTARPTDPDDLPQTVTPLHPSPLTDGGDHALVLRQPPLRRWRGSIITAVVMAVIWAVLLGDQPGSWLLGVPAIIGGVALAATIPQAPPATHIPGTPPATTGPVLRLSARGVVVFIGWFAGETVRGASDVAWRACHFRPNIAPGFRGYTTTLPAGAPRTLFANCITLLPGTLTVDLRGDWLTIHMLDHRQDLEADLGTLERRVAAIWGLPLHTDGKDHT